MKLKQTVTGYNIIAWEKSTTKRCWSCTHSNSVYIVMWGHWRFTRTAHEWGCLVAQLILTSTVTSVSTGRIEPVEHTRQSLLVEMENTRVSFLNCTVCVRLPRKYHYSDCKKAEVEIRVYSRWWAGGDVVCHSNWERPEQVDTVTKSLAGVMKVSEFRIDARFTSLLENDELQLLFGPFPGGQNATRLRERAWWLAAPLKRTAATSTCSFLPWKELVA